VPVALMEGREVDEDISNVRSVEKLCESDELMQRKMFCCCPTTWR
jgi:hypothetical protein